jgi:hypothetical protein
VDSVADSITSPPLGDAVEALMTGLLAWNSPWLERGLLVEFTIQSFLRVLADGGVGSGRRAFERVLVDGNWDN